MSPALYALALASFAIGTTEVVVVGLLPAIAQDLAASLSTAGLRREDGSIEVVLAPSRS